MFGYHLDEFQRAQLCSACARWWQAISEAQSNEIISGVLDSFYAWRDQQGDAHGQIKVVSADPFGGGLLGIPVEEIVPVADLEPWRCGGPLVHNDIDLAFKLFGDADEGFRDVTLRYGLYEVLSVITLYSLRTAELSSLIRANAFFVAVLSGKLDAATQIGRAISDELGVLKAQRKESLKSARKKQAEDRSAKAAHEHAQMRQMALDYKAANSFAEIAEIAAYLIRCGMKQQQSTIERIIAGVSSQAKSDARKRRSARPNLYATGQPRKS